LTQLNKSYLESINNIDLSKSLIEEEYQNIISNAEKKAENLKRQVSGSTKLSVRNKELVLLEHAVNEVYEKAKEKLLLYSEDPKYRNMLTKLLDETIPNLGTYDLIIECLKKDINFFKNQIDSLSLKYNKKIKIQGNLQNLLGGFKIKSSDGTITLDNTIDSRMESLKPLIRKNIAQLLRGMVN
jgi:V/A-type H+-transporting ATPase subunit E